MYKAAIVGLGNIAWRFDHNIDRKENFQTHGFSFLHFEGIELVGGCSPDEQDRYQFAGIFDVPVFETLAELLDMNDPDIVSICSPSSLHYEQALYCLQRQVPMIWLEKPPTGSRWELDNLIDEQKRQAGKSVVLVNYQRRYVSSYNRLKKVYQEKKLGECRLVQLNYSRGLETNGSHLLDMLFYVIGDDHGYQLEWVSSSGDHENPCFFLRLDNGLTVLVAAAALPYHWIDISLVCDEGRVSILHGGMTPVVEKRVEHELFPGFYRLSQSGTELLGVGGFDCSMEEALRDLIYAYERKVEPRSNLRSAVNSLALIEDVRRWQRERNR